MCAVGSIKDVYSVGNIYLDEYDIDAEKIHKAYSLIQGHKELDKIHKERIKDDYKYWANHASIMHTKYKMFSMGIFYDSVFNFESIKDEKYKKSIEVARNRYERIISGKMDFETPKDAEKHINLLHELAWLEHRRWNAFTRVKGFRHTDAYDAYAITGEIGSYKQMELKLHPCLVECDKKGIRAEINHKGEINEATLLKSKDRSDFDLLDDLSYDLKEKGYNNYDFKQYDYPVSVFS